MKRQQKQDKTWTKMTKFSLLEEMTDKVIQYLRTATTIKKNTKKLKNCIVEKQQKQYDNNNNSLVYCIDFLSLKIYVNISFYL